MISKKDSFIKASAHFLNRPLPENWEDYGTEGILDFIDRHVSDVFLTLDLIDLWKAIEGVANEYQTL